MHWKAVSSHCGRGGDLTSVFVADDATVKAAIGKRLYFGEVLGKHSEVYGDLDEGDLTVLTDDQSFIERFEQYVPKGVGRNPLNYLSDEEESEE